MFPYRIYVPRMYRMQWHSVLVSLWWFRQLLNATASVQLAELRRQGALRLRCFARWLETHFS